MKKFTVQNEDSLQNFTDNHYAQASFCFRTLLKDREIRVNGKKVMENVALREGDEVEYFLTAAQAGKKAFSIVYEDENLYVLDKESGVNSEAVFEALNGFPVHRLDRNTAGLLLLAKSASAQEELLSAFRERRVEKIYHALVLGKMPQRHEILNAYLKKDERSGLVKISLRPEGEKIVTEYEVLEEREETSLLKITLHTGKTHQIRAHLAFVGHPIVGDEKYGDSAYNRSVHRTRQMLLAKSLSLQTKGSLSDFSGRVFVSDRNL